MQSGEKTKAALLAEIQELRKKNRELNRTIKKLSEANKPSANKSLSPDAANSSRANSSNAAAAGSILPLLQEIASNAKDSMQSELFYSNDVYMCVVEWEGNDFRFILPNNKFAEFHNMSVQTITGKRASEVGYPEDFFNFWINTFAVCSQANEALSNEFPFNINGIQRWFKGTISPLKIPGEVNPHFNFSAFEITEYFGIEEAFKQSEQRFKRLLESVTDYIYTVKVENGKAVSTIHGPGCLAVTGFASDDYKNNPALWIKMVYYEDQALVIDQGLKVLSGENPPPLEHRIIHADGSIRWIRNSTVVRYDSNHAVVAFDGLVTDITERKNMEALLSRERDMLQNLMNYIPDTIYFKDNESRFTKINQAQADMLGLKNPEEAIGKSDFDFFTHEHASAAYKDEQQMMKTGQPLIDKQEYIKKGDGTFVWVSATKVPVTDRNGKSNGIVGISRNITERIKAEEVIQKYTRELEEINASKDKLFSIIAHDLRSPFNGLLGFAGFLISELDNLSKDEISVFALNIKNSVQNILDLLNNLLEWARLQLGRINPRPEVITLREKTNELIKLFAANLSGKNLTIINEVPVNTLVRADCNMLTSVMQNLISNAIKFTRPGGLIKISSRLLDNDVEVSVSDNGVGIPEENLSQIFKIDSNLSTPGTEKENGSGLGLILCKEMIEKNNGKIYVESKPGLGSSFKFTLPSGC